MHHFPVETNWKAQHLAWHQLIELLYAVTERTPMKNQTDRKEMHPHRRRVENGSKINSLPQLGRTITPKRHPTRPLIMSHLHLHFHSENQEEDGGCRWEEGEAGGGGRGAGGLEQIVTNESGYLISSSYPTGRPDQVLYLNQPPFTPPSPPPTLIWSFS